MFLWQEQRVDRIAGYSRRRILVQELGHGGIVSCDLNVGSWSATEKTKLICEHTINFSVNGIPMKSSC
jgi:hypothetical protein